MRLMTLCAVAVSTAAVCGSVYADSGLDSKMTDPEYSKLDKDSNGKLTKSEAAANKDLVAEWSRVDSNKDGTIDKAEFAKFEAAAKSGSEKP